MILGVPSVQQWERVKVINKLVRCLEWLSIGWCLCVCVFDDAGVSVSERCLKGVKIVRWWVLCSQITASDKALEKHWLYPYLSSAPYLRWRDVSLSSRGLSKDRFPPCTTMQRCAFKSSQAACSQTRLYCQQVHTGLSLHLEPCAAAGFGDEPSCRYVKGTFRRQSLRGCAFVYREWQVVPQEKRADTSLFVTPVSALVGRACIAPSHWTGLSSILPYSKRLFAESDSACINV